MLYILTGVAKSGKSLVAKELVKRYHLPLTQTDHIMMMLYRGNPNLNIHIDASDSTVAFELEPYLRGLFQTIIENKKDHLVEGVHLLTSYAHELMTNYPTKVRILYLGYANQDPIIKGQELKNHAHLMENPWYMSYPEKEFHQLMVYMVKESQRIKKECADLHIPYVDIHDIFQQKDDIIKLLMGS
ncbi:MAG: hypothetical protein C4537_02370 [Acholeplasma sp.]|jgi:gluconate kinase|nr:MAG: hypothetical protein C4537_02370 [Acholeplasma sp.]